MTIVGEGDLGDYMDPTVRYVPLEPIENHMNDVDRSRLVKYLDPEFIDAEVDSKAKDAGQLELEHKEKIDTEFDLDEAIANELRGVNLQEAMLNPREYQYELYQKALEENVIVVLDTGAGKTLISVMLIKSMVLQEREARLTRFETKLAFFLVERVPLVFQQASVIKANCDVNLEQMCGEMEVDTWSEKRWKQIFEENDVCVMTAQIFLDTLRHGFISLDKVHLLIFDECHHATKRHPFNLIMREFYDRCPLGNRPKIFGMTASPMHSRSSVQQLEKNLDARVYTAKNLEELNQSINKGQEITVEYHSPPFYNETPLSAQVREKLGNIPRYRRCFIITSGILSTLGPWCSDYMWKIMLTDLEKKMSRATQNLDREALMQEDLALKETHEFIDTVPFPRNPDVYNTELFSPKIQLLIKILNIFVNKSTDFCGIVFVERRHTAVAIQKLIESLDCLNNARCSVLTGHGSTEEGDIQMTFKEQNKIIEKFRTGELNLLIATNVAEEGLDIQPCNVVIRFDFFHTLIAYIQSRGRARKKDSKYVVLVESQNMSQHNNFQDFRALEAEMKTFCQILPSERNVANKFSVGQDLELDSSDEEDSDEEDYLEYSIIVPETGATITKQNAVPLLHKYCSSLPSDSFCVLKPIFETITTGQGFVCKLTLPSNAAIQELTSPVVRSKTQAKALVALQACEQLRSLNALDNHLLPHNYRREILGEMAPQFDENGYIIGVEDNSDLLQAQVNHTSVRRAETVYTEANQNKEPNPVIDQNVPEAHLLLSEQQESNVLAEDPKEPESQMNDLATENNLLDLGEPDGPFSCWFTVFEVQLEGNQFEEIPYRRLCLISKKPFPTFPDLKLFHKSNPFMVKVRNIETEVVFERETILLLSDYMLKLMLVLINKKFHCPIVDIPYYI
ncbi:Dicer-like protein 1, partial [Rhizopus stolonifer]